MLPSSSDAERWDLKESSYLGKRYGPSDNTAVQGNEDGSLPFHLYFVSLHCKFFNLEP